MTNSAVDLVVAFNEAINARNRGDLVASMSPDHRFVDSAGSVVEGREACRAAWASFFASFPDYRNVFEFVELVAPNRVVVRGRSQCAVEALDGPAQWHAIVSGDSVVEWRVEDLPPAH